MWALCRQRDDDPLRQEVSFNGKTGYAHGKYLNVTDSAKRQQYVQ